MNVYIYIYIGLTQGNRVDRRGDGDYGHVAGSLCPLKDSEAVLGVWLPVPLPTSRAPPDRSALCPLA